MRGTSLVALALASLLLAVQPAEAAVTTIDLAVLGGGGELEGGSTFAVQGVSLTVTNPARTVVDCFRYRNKIGLDVAMEALRDAVRSRKAMISEIDRAALPFREKTLQFVQY